MIVLVKTELVQHISEIELSTEATGALHVVGNKGGLILRHLGSTQLMRVGGERTLSAGLSCMALGFASFHAIWRPMKARSTSNNATQMSRRSRVHSLALGFVFVLFMSMLSPLPPHTADCGAMPCAVVPYTITGRFWEGMR